ncbi:hypothetical protein BGX21_009462 [Mortierella sp. AD011]|nr:hypothetical protein BGX20_008251 [Mortierella sp. AD010]KAF9396660.1 hypothetical protein BGX21_009462 [Mortierella sp. AD011]
MSDSHTTEPPKADPTPLGIFSFAVTTVIANLYNVGAGVPPGGGGDILQGFALWYGGIVQILAGMWCMHRGNTWDATAFSSFGAYWAAYGYMFFPGSGMVESYASYPPEVLRNAKGTFLIVWALMAIILTVGAIRSTYSTIVMLLMLDVHLVAMSIYEFGHYDIGAWPQILGGSFGLVCGLIAFWNGSAVFWAATNGHIHLPVGHVRRESKSGFIV